MKLQDYPPEMIQNRIVQLIASDIVLLGSKGILKPFPL